MKLRPRSTQKLLLDRAYDVLHAEIDAIDNIELGPSFAKAIKALYSCRGPILTTGMGKAGHIARKFAATLCSTGSPAVYLHPGDAAHGDSGIIHPFHPDQVVFHVTNAGPLISEISHSGGSAIASSGGPFGASRPKAGSCMVAFSTSGKTQEVLETIKQGWNLGLGTVICVTSHPDSELRELSSIVIDMGVIKEAGELGLAPSASIAAMLAISDALAIILSEEKGFLAAEFGARHHGGYLGKKARRG